MARCSLLYLLHYKPYVLQAYSAICSYDYICIYHIILLFISWPKLCNTSCGNGKKGYGTYVLLYYVTGTAKHIRFLLPMNSGFNEIIILFAFFLTARVMLFVR